MASVFELFGRLSHCVVSSGLVGGCNSLLGCEVFPRRLKGVGCLWAHRTLSFTLAVAACQIRRCSCSNVEAVEEDDGHNAER
jgi:hypothetical protein